MITTLKIKNLSKAGEVFYLTLGSYPSGYVQEVKGVFGIMGSGLQGSFVLAPNEEREFTCPEGLAISGNFSVGAPPLNDPPPEYPNGMSLFEFTLNNSLIEPPGQQETVDISCVAGVNAHWIGLLSGEKWNASKDHPDVTKIENSGISDNHGRVGVFPFGCDDCTKIKNPPAWPNHPPFDKPQDKPICNVQRPAEKAGGVVEALFAGMI